MPFENSNEAKADKTQDAKAQQGHAALAQQAWGPQATKDQPKQTGTPSDAQQQINNGLAMVGDLYNGLVHGAQDTINGAVKGAEEMGKAAVKGVQDGVKSAAQGAEDMGKAAVKGVEDGVKSVVQAAENMDKGAEQGVEDFGKTLNQTADTAAKVTQILGNGLEVGVDAFGKSLQQDSTVQATERLATDIGKAIVRNAEQQQQDSYDLLHDPAKLAIRTFANESLRLVGAAQGVFNFENKLSQQITGIAQNPQEALAKTGAGIVGTLGAVAKVGLDITAAEYTGNFKGLGDDYNEFEKFAKKTTNDVLNGTDYLVNANPLQQGEVFGHYVIPAVVGAAASKFVGGKLFGATEKFAGAGEAGEGTGVVENSRKFVGKALDAHEKIAEIDENAAKGLFGKHHETISGIQKKVEHVEKPMHHAIEGGHHAAKHAAEAAAEQQIATGAQRATESGMAQAAEGGIAVAAGIEAAISAASRKPNFELPKLEISEEIGNPKDYIDPSNMSTKELLELLAKQGHQTETSRWAQELAEAEENANGVYISEINGKKIQPKVTLC